MFTQIKILDSSNFFCMPTYLSGSRMVSMMSIVSSYLPFLSIISQIGKYCISNWHCTLLFGNNMIKTLYRLYFLGFRQKNSHGIRVLCIFHSNVFNIDVIYLKLRTKYVLKDFNLTYYHLGLEENKEEQIFLHKHDSIDHNL